MTTWAVTVTHVLLLVAVGFFFEVLFTAFGDYPKTKDKRLRGYTYVWMIPIYALLYPGFSFLYPRLAAYPLLARGFAYTLIIFAVEYVSGWLLRKTVGECPWEREYRGHRWAVHDLIRLDFTPAWIVASLLFEWTFRVLVYGV